MALHISGKLFALGLVIALLITAFSVSPTQKTERAEPVSVGLNITPQLDVLPQARNLAERQTTLNVTQGPVATPSFTLRATGYNSLRSQTDSTPFITATGARTRVGVIAISRDLLAKDIPYGSLVRIKDLGSYYNGRGYGKFQAWLDRQELFIVEDTLHPRKRQQVDVWFETMSEALNWGVRQVEVEVVRYGRNGPVFNVNRPAPLLNMTPQLSAARPLLID